MIQALIKGEVDFVEDITALQVEVARGSGRHHRDHERRLAGLRRDRVQHRRDRHRDRQADGRRQPGAAGRRLPARARVRHRPRRDHRAGLPGRRRPGHHDHPAGLRRLPLGAARGRGLHLRPRPGRASCSTRPATRWATTGSGPCRTATRSAPCGCSRGRTSIDLGRRHELLPGVAGRRRHQVRGRGRGVQQPDRA